jgi:prepilin-type processing-associated H-X9-DG protein
MQCQNNLKQLGLAAHNYHDNYSRFPPAVLIPWARVNDDSNLAMGMVGSAGPNAFGPNWAVFLLPYIEQDNLYRQANVGSFPGIAVTPGTVPAYTSVNNSWRVIVSTPIKTYQCPSDPNNQTPYTATSPTYKAAPPALPLAAQNGWARGNYAATAAFDDFDHTNGGRTYVYGGPVPMKGVTVSPVFAVNYGAGITEITDGTSNTIIFNEIRAGVSNLDHRGTWAIGLPGGSITNAGRQAYNPTPNNNLGEPGQAQGDELGDCNLFAYPGIARRDRMGCQWDDKLNNDSAMARSKHTGGVNACFGDGSVHFISESITELTWGLLNSKADGRVITGNY